MSRHCLFAIALALVCRGMIGAGDIVAESKIGPVTRTEIAVYAAATGGPYRDPVQSLVDAPDEASRQEAALYLKETAREILWSRYRAREARAADFHLSAPLRAQIDAETSRCLASKWRQAGVESVTTLSVERMRELYRRHKAPAASSPELREVSYIFQSTTGTHAAAANAQGFLEQVRGEIVSGRLGFAEAARRYSEAPSAARGGIIGYVKRSDGYHRAFIDLVFSTSENSLSPVTLLHNGWYLLHVGRIIGKEAQSQTSVELSLALQVEMLEHARREAAEALEREAVRRYPQAANSDEAMALEALASATPAADCRVLAGLMEERFLARSRFMLDTAAKLDPREGEIRDYYTSHPSEMMERGQWKLTRFLVPVGASPGTAVRSLQDATSQAQAVRSRVSEGASDSDVRQSYSSAPIVIERNDDWVPGSTDAGADKELLALAPSGLTSVSACEQGAHFFRLDARRIPKGRPIEEMRDYIVGNLRAYKLQSAYSADIEKVMQQIDVRLADLDERGNP